MSSAHTDCAERSLRGKACRMGSEATALAGWGWGALACYRLRAAGAVDAAAKEGKRPLCARQRRQGFQHHAPCAIGLRFARPPRGCGRDEPSRTCSLRCALWQRTCSAFGCTDSAYVAAAQGKGSACGTEWAGGALASSVSGGGSSVVLEGSSLPHAPLADRLRKNPTQKRERRAAVRIPRHLLDLKV